MNTKRVVKTAIRIAKVTPFVTAAAGLLSLAFSKYEEKQGNYSREFCGIEDEIKSVIERVRMSYGN